MVLALFGPMKILETFKNRWLLAFILLAGIAITTGIAMPQSKYRKAAGQGPYRAFLTKPVLGLGYKAGTVYREYEMVSAALNDLHQQGFVPVMTEVLTEVGSGQRTNRLLIICRK